jgi:ketosteroid isomerase-like protein
MTQQEEHLQAFFVRYGDALAAGDLPTVAECYTLPALVVSDAGSIPVATREEVEAAFRGAAEAYRAQGLVSAHDRWFRSHHQAARIRGRAMELSPFLLGSLPPSAANTRSRVIGPP